MLPYQPTRLYQPDAPFADMQPIPVAKRAPKRQRTGGLLLVRVAQRVIAALTRASAVIAGSSSSRQSALRRVITSDNVRMPVPKAMEPVFPVISPPSGFSPQDEPKIEVSRVVDIMSAAR